MAGLDRGRRPAWSLSETWKQPFRFREGNPRHTSFAFFRLFRKTGEGPESGS